MPDQKPEAPAVAALLRPAGLVLYIDDDASSRVVLERSLGSMFRIALAADAQDALELMKREPPAVVLSDERMPGMGGAELLAQVRVLYPDAIRVIVSAYSDPDAMLRAINAAGATRFMVKPWDRTEIIGLLSSLLTEHRLAQEIRNLQLDALRTERFALLGRATAEVVHDLVNPLTSVLVCADSVLGSAEVLRPRLDPATAPGGPLSSEETEALSEMVVGASELRDSTRYMSQLVGGIRNISRAEQRSPRANPCTIATFAITLARGRINWPRYVLAPMAELPDVAMAPMHLCQVLTNLLTNAGQSVPQGKVGNVECGASLRDGGVEFRITDTGVGMAPEIVARLGREEFSTKPDGEGTGLGVALCFRLVCAAGGRISYESTPGKGTQVRVWVPQAV